MIEIDVPETTIAFGDGQRAKYIAPTRVRLEHSLLAMSKWEAKYQRSFLNEEPRTSEEVEYYIRCMALDDVEPYIFSTFSSQDYDAIQAYISASHTATTFQSYGPPRPGRMHVVTTEVIYYMMIVRGIPFDVETWPIDRLMILLKVYDIESNRGKKGTTMSAKQSAQWRIDENERRKRMMKSKG